MQHYGIRTGTLTRDQLGRFLEILRPYKAQPFNAAVIELAARLARAES